MPRIAPVPWDECKDLATVFEITEAVMGFVRTVCSLWRAIRVPGRLCPAFGRHCGPFDRWVVSPRRTADLREAKVQASCDRIQNLTC
jgi:hypothetical protein